MADKLKEIPGKILEWWKKFTNKQRTIIVAIVAVVIFTFVIIIYAFTRPQYTHLNTFSDRKEAAAVIDILNEAGITHKESADLQTIEVLTGQISQANYAMAAAGYVPDSLKMSDFVKGGMSVTSWEQQRQFEEYLGEKMAMMFRSLSFVRDAKVSVTLADQTGTLWAQQNSDDSTAYIQLSLSGTFSSANATAIARSAATVIGNATTANITIIDYDGNLLFAGGDDYSPAASANSLQELQEQAQITAENQTRRVLLGTNQYSTIDVKIHYQLDYATYENKVKEYYANNGMTQGLTDYEILFNSSGVNSVAGTPGTDSNGNDITDYDNPDYGSSENEETEEERHYLPNTSEKNILIPAGVIDYTNSSMAISMITRREYYEDTVKNQGLLAGITWEQFKEEHREDVRRDVDEELYQMACAATGISRDKIVIISYETPIFYDSPGLNISTTDVLSIVMIVLILLLLGFVVLRSMGTRNRAAEEEELSVEGMLQSTPETTMEDIDVEAKSETRKLIEKFVDENPEAAANLLRNWLTEDWS